MPLSRRDVNNAGNDTTRGGRDVEVIAVAMRQSYHDGVRLAAREEILADLAMDAITARLHADTARFHHGSAHAYAKALGLLVGRT